MGQTGNTQEIRLGLADVSYGGVSLGFTVEGVVVTVTHQQAPIVVDDFGETPVDIYDIGEQIVAVVPITQISLPNLNIAIPGGTLTSDRIKVGRQAGTKLTSQELILDATNSGDFNITIYRAIVTVTGDWIYNNEQRVLPVTFTGVIDTSRPDGDRLYRIGGPAS